MVATRSLGVVYTPASVTVPMAELALAPLGNEPRVCDPAIGTGAFADAIVDVLVRRGADLRRANQRIFGADVDARAVALARRGRNPANIVVGDALSLDWSALAPFDLVIGNPPYIRQESLAAAKSAMRGYEVYDGVADLYVYFVELAHRIARRYCLIIPNKWMTAAYGRPLRRFLAAQRSVEGIVDFSRALPLFPGADAFPCIVWGTVGARTRAIRARRASGAAVADELAISGAPHAGWRDEPWHIDDPGDHALISRLERIGRPLGELVGRPSRGVVTGCNRAFVLDGAARAELLAAEPAAEALVRPLVKGRDVGRWTPRDADRYILLVDRGTSLARLPRTLAHLARFRDALEPKPDGHRGAWHGRKPGAYRWYELQDPVGPLVKSRGPRLLYQDIQTQPACCLDRSGAFVPDTTVWMLPTDDLVLLAILNSSVYAWFARRRFPPALNGAVRPKLEYIRTLPIPEPSRAQRTAIETLVERRLAGADLDAELDAAVCDLYALSRADRKRVSSPAA
jgi:hypothetical protein